MKPELSVEVYGVKTHALISLHTTGCCMQAAKDAFATFLFAQAHPLYCRTCNGAGVRRYSHDPSPAGVSLSPGSMEDTDPCEDCLEKGICPICGRRFADDQEGPVICAFCGWDEEQPTMLVISDGCFCYEYAWADELPDYPILPIDR